MATNRLSRGKSPYLLQHQHNPVDWYAWGDEAFTKARTENKPVFLSIGYSTCHWCHVMERESFEDPRIAAILNLHFVSIKVDREERPDIDRIYMTFVQGLTGQGGWPLNVFLTPDLKPFYGGTYFPPDNRHGRPSFTQMLNQIVKLWQERRNDLIESADQIYAQLQDSAVKLSSGGKLPATEVLRNAGEALKEHYDPRNGGFGTAPKFPQPSHPRFLLQYATRFNDNEAQRMVLHTCERMAAGGIYDHLGGGFSRYSVDSQWLVPHFEKMLYDNAQLAQLYLDAFLVSGEQSFAQTVRGILDYVLRDMTHGEGGFYSAEDADSEGQEGKFYCWTLPELSNLLSSEEYNVAVHYFGLTAQGNFIDHSHPDPLKNLNVLSIADPHLSPADTELLEQAKTKMREARAKRVRPGLDDKVLSSWNGLMLAAFARASVVLREPGYLKAATLNAAFIRTRLWDPTSKTLFHRWRAGERDSVQLLDAYAFVLDGVLELYQATLVPDYLAWAIDLADSLLARFYDEGQGAFWQSGESSTDLIVRMKDEHDGALPSGTSVATWALLKLAAITDVARYKQVGEACLDASATRLGQIPQAFTYMLLAADFALEEPYRAVVSGAQENERVRQLVAAVHGVYQNSKVVLGNAGPVEPFARTLPSDPPLVYVCTGTSCQAPTSDDSRIRELLSGGKTRK